MTQTFTFAAFMLILSVSALAEGNPCPKLSHARTVQVTEMVWSWTLRLGFHPFVNCQVEMVIPQPGKAFRITSKPISLRIEERVTKMGSEGFFRLDHSLRPSMFVVDGKTEWDYSPRFDNYSHDKFDPKAFFNTERSRWYLWQPALALFVTSSLKAGPFSRFKPADKVLLNGKPMRLYQYRNTDENGWVSLEKLWVDPATHLPTQISSFEARKGRLLQEVKRFVYQNWTLNKPISRTEFSWRPPATAEEYNPDTSPTYPAIPPPLLNDDAIAPKFTVQDKDGKPVHLSDYKGKVVVLDFWATWCDFCQSGLRRTLPAADKYAPQGVVFLAVNVWDKKADFDKWLPQYLQYAPFLFAIDLCAGSRDVASQYQASSIPAQFVIGKDGKIVAGLSGYGGQELEEAIQAATGAISLKVYHAKRATDQKMQQNTQ